jgi:hypothetical protein
VSWTDLPVSHRIHRAGLLVFALVTDTAESKITQDRRKRMFGIILAALDRLLQTTLEEAPTPKPGFSRTRSAASHISLPAVVSDGMFDFETRALELMRSIVAAEHTGSPQEEDLEHLLKAINLSLTQSAVFREMFTRDQVETIIPSLADYISMSANPVSVSNQLLHNRGQVAQMLGNLRDRCQGDGILQSQVGVLSYLGVA